MHLPTYLQIEPVGQCNLRCQMCAIQFRGDGPPDGSPSFMPLSTFTQIIDQFPTLETLHLQGLGEPLMHPYFFDMVEYAARLGIQVTSNSNLTLLTEAMTHRCVTSGLDCLHISIDGATAATYERIRVGSHFDRLLANLERLRSLKTQLRSTLPRLQLVMVVMRQNLQELPDLVQLAHRFGMDGMFVQHLCHDFGESTLPAHYRPMRDFVQVETLLEEETQVIEQVFNQARSLAQTLGVNLRLPSLRPQLHSPGTPGRDRCNWPWHGMYISYQGLAMPCCMVSTPDRIHFGNALAQGLDSTWNSLAYEQFRAQLDSDIPPEVCRSCSLYSGTF